MGITTLVQSFPTAILIPVIVDSKVAAGIRGRRFQLLPKHKVPTQLGMATSQLITPEPEQPAQVGRFQTRLGYRKQNKKLPVLKWIWQPSAPGLEVGEALA